MALSSAIIDTLHRKENAAFLTGIVRGVEREALRCTDSGQLALTQHPSGLGSALTHPRITTDFSESLIELITPPSHYIQALFESLEQLHAVTEAELQTQGELLWPLSMPCQLPGESAIPIAQYGSSHNAQLKTVYRRGLALRYGKQMQAIAGVHYNFSLPNAFWAHIYRETEASDSFQEFKDQGYLSLIRNFRRYYWLLIYLFGASPCAHASFLEGRSHNLDILNKNTYYLPFATSLRMGGLGYQSTAQESLHVCYNDLNTYIATLCKAINTPWPEYQSLGDLAEDGTYQQLNTCLLQIENEFYSPIRPKRTAKPGETALAALQRRGIEYVEVRCLDVNPESAYGISEEQVKLLDVLLVFCALQHSPACDEVESARVLQNQQKIVIEGRKSGLKLLDTSGEPILKEQWANEIIDQMLPIAEALDSCYKSRDYSSALSSAGELIRNPDATPSAQLLQTQQNHEDYIANGLKFAKQHREAHRSAKLTGSVKKIYSKMKHQSLENQKRLELKSTGEFPIYLRQYYQQYDQCKNLDRL